MRIALAFLLACSFARADSLTDLKKTLATLHATEPLTATVDYQLSNRTGDDKAAAEGKVSALVEDRVDGLRIQWARAVMDAAVAEEIARSKDRNLAAPTRRAMDALNATTLNDYLNGGAQMLRELDQAELVEEKAVQWNGQPARLLSLKITPVLSEKDKKYIKEIEASGKVWVDAEGWPLAAEQSLHLKGRAMLVITFEQTERQELRYARMAGRLVTIYHLKESHGSGGGESGQNKTITTLTVAKS